MKKITIAISEESHAELLKIQLDKRLKHKTKTSLAEVTAEVLHDLLVVQNKTPTK
jgi:hypothetical protein